MNAEKSRLKIQMPRTPGVMPSIPMSEEWKRCLRNYPWLTTFAIQLHAFHLQDCVDLRRSAQMEHRGQMGFFFSLRHMATPDLDWMTHTDQQFANAPADSHWYHGTVWVFLFRLLSAGRLLRGPHAKDGKFAVYITPFLHVAVTYAPPGPVDGNRYVVVLETLKVKRTGNPRYKMIKEYWHQMLGLIVLPDFYPSEPTNNPPAVLNDTLCRRPFTEPVKLHNCMKANWTRIDWEHLEEAPEEWFPYLCPRRPSVIDMITDVNDIDALDMDVFDDVSNGILTVSDTPATRSRPDTRDWMSPYGQEGRLDRRRDTMEHNQALSRSQQLIRGLLHR